MHSQSHKPISSPPTSWWLSSPSTHSLPVRWLGYPLVCRRCQSGLVLYASSGPDFASPSPAEREGESFPPEKDSQMKIWISIVNSITDREILFHKPWQNNVRDIWQQFLAYQAKNHLFLLWVGVYVVEVILSQINFNKYSITAIYKIKFCCWQFSASSVFSLIKIPMLKSEVLH